VESRERADPRDLRVQVHRPRESGFMSESGEVAHRQTHGALHPRVNLASPEVAVVNLARAVDHQVTTTVHGELMMAHGQIVPTMDVSSFFVDVNINPAVDSAVLLLWCCCCCCMLLGSVHLLHGYSMPRLCQSDLH